MKKFTTQCSCGQAGAEIRVTPRVRFRCHCTKCQSVYRAPFADALVFRRGQVKPIDASKITWIRTMRPSPLSRGLCSACRDPVIAHLYGALSIIPARTANGLEIPSVGYDVYYGTRVEDLDDGVPKYASALRSYLGLALPFTRVITAPGRAIG